MLVMTLLLGWLSQDVRCLETNRNLQRQSCNHKPVSCLWDRLGVAVPHSCSRDSDCSQGWRCCTRGCVRRCVLWNPCQTVVCDSGYTCTLRYSFLSNRQEWLPQADCVPDEKKLCRPLSCPLCQAGYKQRLDKDGCPTCDCVAKNDCRKSGCRMLCAYGQETGQDGCPICKCKAEPENPCAHLNCAEQEECRLVARTDCDAPPCNPAPQCVPRANSTRQFDDACSTWDDSTVHLPVVSQNCPRSEDQGRPSWCELDCRLQACPERTVCVHMGQVRSRCCWQATQALLLPPSKAGECPPPALVKASLESLQHTQQQQHSRQRCQLDAQCPGQHKCCSSRNTLAGADTLTGSGSVYGYCTVPTHQILDDLVTNMALKSTSFAKSRHG
ncbi:kunitz domain-containing protein [Plakobranchus ocellatus]|uniref:Kunitz domain-containing protein n=1 Tax=Plakobranchus ocellatus TaxID=259542 RepID=A0AAV3ZDA2_9GAST|nr:kunitz domain-containing protein [Plakobranchus ocellatus]